MGGLRIPLFLVSSLLVPAGITTAETRPALQSGGAGPALTLERALDEALDANPELQALRRQFDAVKERPAQERFLAAPTFEAQIWQWPVNTVNPSNTNMYMFMAGQEFPGRGKRRLREALAAKDVELAEVDIAVRARAVIDHVKRAYADLFLARKATEVHHESVALLRQIADVAQVKYAAGRLSQQDVLQAVVELSRIHDHLIGLDEQAALAEAELNALLARPPGAPIGPLADPRERALVTSAERLQDLALEHQPELAAARVMTERAEARLAVVNRSYGPDFFAMAGFMLMPADRDAWMAKVGITWPAAPWSRGRLDAERAEAVAAIGAANANRRTVENALGLAVQQAYIRVKAAEQRAALIRTTVLPQARQALAVSRVAYQADTGAFLAIIDSERTRLDAELDYYGALGALDQALADLERAIGIDLTAAMVAPVDITGAE